MLELSHELSIKLQASPWSQDVIYNRILLYGSMAILSYIISTFLIMYCVVCVYFLPIQPGRRHVRWMYQPGSHRRKCHTGVLSHLSSAVHAFIFLARGIQPFLSLVDREVEFCVLKRPFFMLAFFSHRKLPISAREKKIHVLRCRK